MGCGCGKKGSNLRTLQPTKILSLSELREKIVGNKPSIMNGPISIRPPEAIETIFKKVTEKINPLVYTNEKKTILLITKNGNAEGKYLKNIITKLSITSEYKNKLNYLEVENIYLINPQDFTIFPTCLFVLNKQIFKRISGLFDVKSILNDFYHWK